MAKILVVDDEESLSDMLATWLRNEGHEVVVCGDPTEAERLALEQRPDLALIDFQMPRKTGAQVLAGLRAREEARLLPVLFMSGTEAVRFASLIPPDPRVRFMHKPMDLPILLTMVSEMLDPDGWSARA